MNKKSDIYDSFDGENDQPADAPETIEDDEEDDAELDDDETTE